MPERVFGIDLGTTYSCIAYIDELGRPVTLKNSDNDSITASVVYFEGGNVIVGKAAKNCAKLEPHNTVEMVKRRMGDADYVFENNGQTYRPEDISALILRKVVADAESSLGPGTKISDVVITCPAYFGSNEREATANAGKIAGLNVRRVINEPTAAALAYGIERGNDQVVLVYDLGGGTFDITMIEVKGQEIKVICTGGDHNLGGKDWDKAIVDYLAACYRDQTGMEIDILEDAETLQDLYGAVEEAKKSLSQRERAPIRVTHGGQMCRVELTRERFESLTAHLLENTISMTHQMLAEARNKGYARFDKILLVGGSTRMPQVNNRLRQEFAVEIELYDPDESVAKGAALYGYKLALGDEIKMKLAGWTGQSADEIDLGKVDEKTIKDAIDEIAPGHGMSTEKLKEFAGTILIDVASKTFGIVTTSRADHNHLFVSNLICRNTRVPAAVTKDFCTLYDDQKSVDIRLMENLDLGDEGTLGNSTSIGQAELPLPSRLSSEFADSRYVPA